jgi:hypothetical protein
VHPGDDGVGSAANPFPALLLGRNEGWNPFDQAGTFLRVAAFIRLPPGRYSNSLCLEFRSLYCRSENGYDRIAQRETPLHVTWGWIPKKLWRSGRRRRRNCFTCCLCCLVVPVSPPLDEDEQY